MKQITLLILLSFSFIIVKAQNNKWIDFDKTYFKIKVAEDGIYKVDFNTLTANNFDNIRGNQLALMHMGEEIPLFTSNDGRWKDGDYFEFYGKANDGEFDKNLFEDPSHQLHTYWSQFTDTAVYFLTTGAAEERFKELNSNFTDIPEKEDYFMYESVYYTTNSHFYGVGGKIRHTVDTSSYVNSYLAKYEEGEGWVGNIFGIGRYLANFTEININTPAIYLDGPKAALNIKVIGQSNDQEISPDHILNIKLNEKIIVEDKYDGYSVQKYEVTDIDLAELESPVTTIECVASNYVAKVDRNGISYATIEYPRTYDFENIDNFAFTIKEKANGNYIEFENLEAEESYELYDLNSNLKLPLLYDETAKIHKIKLLPSNDTLKHLYLHKENTTKKIDMLESIQFTDFDATAKHAQFIVISHPRIIDDGTAVQDYIEYRKSVRGGGFKTALINVEELYDQYAFGIRKHPMAIKLFLDNAIENHGTKPAYCFLLGKGVKNSKCRKNTDNWNKNLVPTFGDSPSDQYFGSDNFDPLSRISIGRFSATNGKQVSNYLDKVINTEKTIVDNCNYLEEQAWKHKMLHVVGGSEIEQQDMFLERSMKQANIAKSGSNSALTNFITKSTTIEEFLACAAIKDDQIIVEPPFECLTKIFSSGRRIVNFLGHANGLIWEVNIGEPEEYTFNNKYPIIIAQANFVGDIYKSFADDNMLSMPEEWLQAENAGASAYIGFNFIYDMNYPADFTDEFYRQVFDENADLRLGDQFRETIKMHYSEDDYIKRAVASQATFAGDPALSFGLSNKPDVAFLEDDVKATIKQINELFYTLDIEFDMTSLNLPDDKSVSYTITKNGAADTEVVKGNISGEETKNFNLDFTLIPGQVDFFTITLDSENQFEEICETNNTFTFKGGEWLVGINDDLLFNQTLHAFPNPFTGHTVFDIQLDNNNTGNGNYIEITSMGGRLINKIKLDKATSKQQIIWNGVDAAGNKLGAGIYIYQLKNDGKQFTSSPGKIILVR